MAFVSVSIHGGVFGNTASLAVSSNTTSLRISRVPIRRVSLAPLFAEDQDESSASDAIPKKLPATIELKDLQPDTELEGLVRTVTTYGAFVDIGCNTDGLLHISQMSAAYVENAADVVSVGDRLKVRVLSVDLEKNNFSLSLRTKEEELALKEQQASQQARKDARQSRISWDDYEVPDEKTFVTGKVISITPFGAFVDVGAPTDGMVHISALAAGRVESVASVLSLGDEVQVRVVSTDRQKNRLGLSMLPWAEKKEGSAVNYRKRDSFEEVDVEGQATKEELDAFLAGQPTLKTAFELAFEKAQARK
eukprot:CAMPEP_0182446678 /NCGR_PEP_ID=MMETSP1172-20130603/4463_1 /TAXON_ID=708627 /ORGANISM="Timspurckia oligopyrenoides, Strain CCMP3278" /LENGTH=306 /DNA_ID=CAMNT_0024642649 /DNA_START=47 /DNA_END=967 /DNA_ORIENTATION=+